MAERKLPPWFNVRFPGGENYIRLKSLIHENGLHTICEEARCPNMGECWEFGTATFLILGEICTRACAYCAVTTGRPHALNPAEPLQVATAVKTMRLRHAVVTSVNRDDLPDGGAAVFVETILSIRQLSPACAVEVLVPDFEGSRDALKLVVDEAPDVFNHNIESVPRVFRQVRPRGSYERSLQLLDQAKAWRPEMVTKSGLIVGMGETPPEVLETMADLREAEVEVLTVGQYLRPTQEARHIPVARFWAPEEFAELKQKGLAMGFRHVESGPLVRSSYHAHEHTKAKAS